MHNLLPSIDMFSFVEEEKVEQKIKTEWLLSFISDDNQRVDIYAY